MAHEETPKAINSDEPYYIVLFQSAEGQTPFSLTVPVHVTLSQYRDGKVTLPLGLDKGFVPVLPCLWYCLQLPRNRFDLVHAPLQGRKALQRLHLPQRIILVPVPLSFSSILRLNNSGPNLIFTSDDLLPVAQSLARELDHVVDVTPASALNVHLLQHHWRALYAALALDRPQYIQPAHLFECAPGKSAHLITQFLARHLRADADHHLPSPGIPQSEILRYALDHQAQLSTIAKLEALRTPPHEAEQIFPQMREEEMERFQCPVSVGVPGISPRVPSRWLEKNCGVSA